MMKGLISISKIKKDFYFFDLINTPLILAEKLFGINDYENMVPLLLCHPKIDINATNNKVLLNYYLKKFVFKIFTKMPYIMHASIIKQKM